MDIKKRFWIFCFVFFLSSVQIIWSQTYPIDKGSKLLFGGMSVQTSSGKLYEDANKNGSFNLTMNPGFAHFVLHGLAVGMMMELSSSFQVTTRLMGMVSARMCPTPTVLRERSQHFILLLKPIFSIENK